MYERTLINFRVGQKGLRWLQSVADKHRTNRSAVIRAALVVARKHEKDLEAALSAANRDPSE